MNKTLSIGLFRVELRVAPDGAFAGIGGVSYGGTALRSGALPWTVRASSGAFEFRSFRLEAVDSAPNGGATIRFAARGEWQPRSETQDAMGESRTHTRRLHAPEAHFLWSFRPASRTVEGERFDGLAMRLEVRSPRAPVHTVLEDTTWEIGGSAAGATLIAQDVSTMLLEQPVARRSAFSTIERFHADGWGGCYPMDMLPRAAGSAFFDFQWKGELALALFAPKPGLTRARLEKYADEDVIHYLDRPFVARAARAVFPERLLLVRRAPRPMARHEARNLWLDCFTTFRAELCGNYGFRPEEPCPMVHAMLWDAELKRLGRDWTKPLRVAMPTFARLGFREVFTHGVWESVTSDPAPKRPGNICCPYRYRYAAKFGGVPAMRATARAAASAGITLYQWFSHQLSRDAPIWKEHPDWVMHRPTGEPWNAGYDELWAGRVNGPYGDWLEKQFLAVREQAGIGGAFWDSFQNLALTCIDWPSDDRAPQAERVFRMMAALQRAGYRHRTEVVTPFGVSQVAMFGFHKDKFRRRLWDDVVRTDAAFALIDTSPGFFGDRNVFNREEISPETYFWLAGHRVLPGMQARPWEPDPFMPGLGLAEEYGRVNRLYNAAQPRMRRLRLVRGGAATLWLDADGRPSVIWCFRAAPAPCREPLFDLETGSPAPRRLVANRVYVTKYSEQ